MIPAKGVVMLARIWPSKYFGPLKGELDKLLIEQFGENAYWEAMGQVNCDLSVRLDVPLTGIVNQLQEALHARS